MRLPWLPASRASGVGPLWTSLHLPPLWRHRIPGVWTRKRLLFHPSSRLQKAADCGCFAVHRNPVEVHRQPDREKEVRMVLELKVQVRFGGMTGMTAAPDLDSTTHRLSLLELNAARGEVTE